VPAKRAVVRKKWEKTRGKEKGRVAPVRRERTRTFGSFEEGRNDVINLFWGEFKGLEGR